MRMVLHSVSYSGTWGGQAALSRKDFFKKAVSLGFSAVELMAKPPHLTHNDFEHPEILAAELKEAGLSLACLGAYTDFTAALSSPMIPESFIQIEYIRQLAKLASVCDCPLIRIFTGTEKEGTPFFTQWNLCVEGVRACADAAAEYGVTIGVQNHHDIAVTADSMLAFLKDVDRKNVKAMYDAWAPAGTGEDLAASARKMAGSTVYTTVADYECIDREKLDYSLLSFSPRPKARRACPMGEGHIDYKGFFTELMQCGFDGDVCYEMCSALRDGGKEDVLDEYARRFLEYMNEFKH